MKLPASAASPLTQMQGSPAPARRLCGDNVRGLPCIVVIGEATLAADLIKRFIFKHLVRNLAAQTGSKAICLTILIALALIY